MSIYKRFKADTQSEKEGIELDYGEFSIRIRRAGGSNKAFVARQEKLHRKHRRAIHAGTLTEEMAMAIYTEVYADTIVISWKGITSEDGTELECTRDNIVKVFRDLPDFFADVREAASDAALFRAAIDELDAKN